MSARLMKGILCLLLGCMLCGAQGPPRRGEYPAATAGLGLIDSLIAVESLEVAAVEARRFWVQFEQSPLYCWQFAGRLGLILHLDGRSAEALEWLERSVAIEPASAEGHLNLAAALMALGRRGRAFSEYQSAVDIAPDSWRIRLDFGQALAEFRQNARARGHLLAALELCGHCPEATRALAVQEVNLGNFKAAAPYLEALYEMDADVSLRPLLARARYENDQLQSCLDLLVPFWPGALSPDERTMVLTVDRRLGFVDRAAELATGLAEGRTDPPDPLYWGQVAQICIDAGRIKEALAANERALELAPEDFVLLTNEAALLQRAGRDDEAGRWLKKAEAARDRNGPKP